MSSAETAIAFDPEALTALGLEIEGVAAVQGRRGLPERRFTSRSPWSLEIAAPRGVFAGFAGGELRHAGELLLRWDDGFRRLNGFRLRSAEGRPVDGEPRGLDLVVGNETLFTLDHIHSQLFADERRLELRYMDLRIAPALAVALGEPRLTGMAIGVVDIEAQVEAPDGTVIERGGCVDPNFDLDTDVALIQIGIVQQSARSGGQVALTPSASLSNVGTADVVWLPAFSGQHPFLTWSLYRIVDGSIEQLAVSDVKHAFFSINSGCSCPGDNILWVGCGDTYGAATNNDRTWLAPRDELTASTGSWEECGSHFDGDPADCQRSHSGEGESGFDHRMGVAESDLETPGARYIFQSWYIVQKDINIYNSMGWVELVPTFLAGENIWSFPRALGTVYVQGSPLDAWVDPTGLPADAASTKLDTGQGEVQLAVRTRELGGGLYRYDLALLNHDFDRKVATFRLPIAPGAEISELDFKDSDSVVENDWAATVEADAIVWQAPADAELDWGRMVSFALTATRGPASANAEVTSFETPETWPIAAVAPVADPPIFEDGFESGGFEAWSVSVQ